MDVRERILAAMSWQEPDQIPLTIYDWMIPTGAEERELREMGVGIITRLPAHRVEHREVQYDSTEYWEDGRHMLRRTIRTPVGEVSQVSQLEAAYGSTWNPGAFHQAPRGLSGDGIRLSRWRLPRQLPGHPRGAASPRRRRPGHDPCGQRPDPGDPVRCTSSRRKPSPPTPGS